MVHPHSSNSISVGYKIAKSFTNNGCIGSIHADTTKIGNYHLAHIVWLHEKKGQTVLPQVSPASSTTSIIVVRQK